MLCEKAFSIFALTPAINISVLTMIQNAIELEIASTDLSTIFSSIDDSVDPQKRRYGTSAQLMGPLGYYSPTRIMEHICNNVRRGRLLRKAPPTPAFVYDYYPAGNIARITNCNLHMVSYALHYPAYDVFICKESAINEIEHILLLEKDENGRTAKWISFYWHNNMKVADFVDIELYRYIPAGFTCTTMHGISNERGIFEGLSCDDFTFYLDEKGRVQSIDYPRRDKIHPRYQAFMHHLT